jgi:hypothetical protein
VILP